MKSPFALLFIIFHTGLFVHVLGLSVRQTPEKIHTTEGENVTINCYIETDSRSERILVVLSKNNLTVTGKNFTHSTHRLSTGTEIINATLHLPSIRPIHSGIYYCKVSIDIPTLETVYGKGTHLYIVNSSQIGTTPSQHLTCSSPVNSSKDTVMKWSLSGLGIILLIVCIAFVIHIYYKGHCRRDRKEKINDATIGSQHSVRSDIVVYAAVNVSENRDGIKSRNENCAALVPVTATCTEESVTYSEVRIKSKRNEEG
ncbi:uncharacterized protein si:dkey-63d15.12 [Triplophysa rosa]|uniref:Ig-like domain-containing protein n=1 Tax=Triplophysa rosa TaxID=992332 RepID=A0A9W7WG17_TRIRA|nr:uncharacterized protein si:dkey-63d15.12 [Triplophysa rosa]KAI7797790.1 hypothetical protein IRJ41_019674 [Triplophysa rosa]